MRKVLSLDDGHVALITAESCSVYDEQNQEITPTFKTIEVDVSQVSRGDYDSYGQRNRRTT